MGLQGGSNFRQNTIPDPQKILPITAAKDVNKFLKLQNTSVVKILI